MVLLGAMLLLASQGPAETDPSMFPFVIPWDDAAAGTVTDVSFLNTMPAGKNGRIVARNGHFYEENSNKRVRFLATNLTARAAFPPHDEADRVAAHLAKYGINLVRFHHLQNNWDTNGGMIWKKGRVYLEVDPEQLDRLDYLIAALKKKGIYTNLNLQTSRNYLPEMGFPQSVLKLTDYSKRIDKVDPKMIELQKQYARDLLDRKNPYTGNRYADEPALMVVEINNENSLVGAPWEGVDGLLGLPEPFRGEIVSRWNGWLKTKYGSTAALVKAWGGQAAAPVSLTGADTKWQFESQGTSSAHIEPIIFPAEPGCAPAMAVEIDKIDETDWHVQAHVDGLTLKSGLDYTVRFEAKADDNRIVRVNSNIDQPDWHSLGLYGSAKVDITWKPYSFAFSPAGVEDGHCRVGFTLGNATGRIQVRRFQILVGNVGGGLKPGESVEKGNIDMPEGGSKRQHVDFVDFLADQEKAYDTEMRSFVTDSLGIKANIVDSQVAWGGLTSLLREGTSSFVDNHAYYNHPQFPGSAWSETNWLVPDTAMTNDMDRYGVMRDLALTRFAGKPYSISEYNEPAPNDHQAEMMPLLASFAADQDWDCLYSFDYGTYGAGQPNDQIQGWFGVGSNPAKKAFFPAAALMFRNFEVAVARDETVLSLPPQPWNQYANAPAAWEGAGGVPNLFESRVSIELGSSLKENTTHPTADGGPALKVTKNSSGTVYTIDSPGAKGVVGAVGGQGVSLNGASFAFSQFGNGFGVLTLTTKDGKAIADSQDILMTVMGRAENQAMGWNKDRSSVGNKWGHGPVMCEGIPCAVKLQMKSPMHVYALDPTGNRKQRLQATYSNGELRFDIGPKDQTVWVEISRS